jgi:hypothetical protein
MTLRNTSIALAAIIAALAALSCVDDASAQTPNRGRGDNNKFVERLPGATSRPTNRDMRETPYMGGHGMRSASGGRRGDRWVQVSRQGAGSGPQLRAPSMGGRGMGGGMGGGRMQGGMGRR